MIELKIFNEPTNERIKEMIETIEEVAGIQKHTIEVKAGESDGT